MKVNVINQIKRLVNLIKRYGIRDLIYKKLEHDIRDRLDYDSWYRKNVVQSENDLWQQRQAEFECEPLISIVVPTYETKERFLEELISSVIAQTYANWELCIADGSHSSKVKDYIMKNYAEEKRIHYKKLDKNLGIAQNTNCGLEMAKGELIGLLDHDDLLAPNALYEVVKAKNENNRAQVFYSDEDKLVDETNKHVQPHFKPDLNWFLIRSNNYICHFFVVETELAREVGGFRSEFDGAQDYDFILRCIEKARATVHISKVLYHWRIHSGSTSVNTSSKLYAYDAGKRAIEAHLKRTGIKGKVTMCSDLGFYRTDYSFDPSRSVEVLNVQEAKKKLTIGEINNYMPRDYYVIVDDSIKMKGSEWKKDMLSVCQRKGVGMVGARIYSARGKMVNSVLTLNRTGKLVPIFEGLRKGFKGDFSRAVTCQNVGFLDAGCIVVSGDILRELGGFSKDFTARHAVADMCMRMEEYGVSVVYQPKAVGTRYGKNKSEAGNDREQSTFIRKWNHRLRSGDRYYNRNLSDMPADYTPRGIKL